jgi:hypothetical protein
MPPHAECIYICVPVQTAAIGVNRKIIGETRQPPKYVPTTTSGMQDPEIVIPSTGNHLGISFAR